MKRKWMVFSVLVLLLLGLAGAGLWYLLQPPDQQQAEELLARILGREEYEFSAQATVKVDGVETPYFQLQGWVNGEESQVSGTVLGEEVELSFRGGQLEQLLPDGSRVSHQLADLGELGQLYAELLPQTAFDYQGVAEFSCKRGDDGLELRIRPEVNNGWVGEYFRDPLYIISCDRLGRRVRSLTLEATEKVNGQATLVLQVEF